MNRRRYLSIIGAVGVCSAGLLFAHQVSEGNINLGDEADISTEVSGTSESFEFEATEGSDIYVTLTDTQDEPYRGAFTLHAPDGTEVLHGGPRTSDMANEMHTARQDGTYRLVVNPQGSSVLVSVEVRNPNE